MLEGIGSDRPAVGAPDVRSCGVTAEIGFHFERLLSVDGQRPRGPSRLVFEPDFGFLASLVRRSRASSKAFLILASMSSTCSSRMSTSWEREVGVLFLVLLLGLLGPFLLLSSSFLLLLRLLPFSALLRSALSAGVSGAVSPCRSPLRFLAASTALSRPREVVQGASRDAPSEP